MVNKISEEELMDWLRKSCEAQGKPLYIEDVNSISAVLVILKSS